MQNELIFQIGEALLLELDGVTSVSYPNGEAYPETLKITLSNGEVFELSLKKSE